MSEYKYKETIKTAINEVYSASPSDEMNRKNELNEVYAKAETFDELMEGIPKLIKFIESVDSGDNKFIEGQLSVLNKLRKFNESGDSDDV